MSGGESTCGVCGRDLALMCSSCDVACDVVYQHVQEHVTRVCALPRGHDGVHHDAGEQQRRESAWNGGKK